MEIDKHGKYISVSNEGGLSSKFMIHRNNNNCNDSINNNHNNNNNKNDNDVVMNGNHSHDDDIKTKSMAVLNNDTHSNNDGIILESLRCSGLFFSVHPNDGVYINRDKFSEHNYLYFLVKGKTNEGLFKKPYLLKQQNTIIISHAFGGSIRVNPKNENIVDSKGSKDILSRWEALPNENSTIVKCNIIDQYAIRNNNVYIYIYVYSCNFEM